MKVRKIEHFETELNASAGGRAVLAVITAHLSEVNRLVNHNRAVMVAWQRNLGPRFLASAMDSGFEADTPIRKEIDGVTLERLLLRMADALQQGGSKALSESIGLYASLVMRAARECASLSECLAGIRSGALLEGGP